MARPYPFWRHMRRVAYSESLALREFVKRGRWPRVAPTRFDW